MNCGLTNLDTLRKHLLADSLGVEKKFDIMLATIGRSVQGMIEAYTNRKLAWQADAQIIFHADRESYVLPRYPVAAVSLVESRFGSADPWETAVGEPLTLIPEAGLIRFASRLGDSRSQVRVTWSGGFWWSTLEPGEENYPETMPDGATALDDALLGAFLLQCEAVWKVHDQLGTGLIGGDASQFLNTRISTLDLVPAIKDLLKGFARYQLA